MELTLQSLPRILFWISTVGVLVLPKRWALLCWLASTHLDQAQRGGTSAFQIDWDNTVRIMVLPSLLLFRLGALRAWNLASQWRAWVAWLAFVGYVAAASSWSPYPIAAIKQFGYLAAYSLIFLALVVAWHDDLIDGRTIRLYVCVALLLAGLSAVTRGLPEGRLTSFTHMQPFAQFLVSAAVVSLICEGGNVLRKVVVALVLSIAVLLTGSRSGLIGLFFAFGIMGAMKLGRLRRPSWLLAHSSIAFAAAGAVGFLGIVASQPTSMPFRAADLFAVAAGDEKLSDIGTFRFRAAIWEAAIDELGESRAASIAFGHGSSSAAGLRARNPSWLAFGVLDGNRVMHNEYLRTVYEWGIFGSLLLGIFLISLIGGALKLGRHGTAVVALSPMLLVSLGVENVFAGSGGPGGSGFALVAALCASRALKARLATRKAAVSAAQRQMLERTVRGTVGRNQPNWLIRAEVPANA